MPFDFSEFQTKAAAALDHFRSELKKLRTGKAHAQLLDSVQVEAYGTFLAIQEVASLNVVDANLLVIKPYDKNLLEALEKSIASSDLNLSPVVSGDVIKIVIPPLTEERRQEMVKVLSQKLEQGRVMLRNIRSEAKREIEDQKDEAGISEDDIERDLQELDDKLKVVMESLEKIGQDKKQELTTL